MRIIELNNISEQERKNLLKRPAINMDRTFESVKPILADVKKNGHIAVLDYAKKFDSFKGDVLKVGSEEFILAEKELSKKTREAIDKAAENIALFHNEQLPDNYEIETKPGVNCRREYRAIENVGLYIPGGTAVLPSTVLMLGIPAKIAGSKRVIACSPASDNLNPAVLYAAKVAGISEFYKVGGAQAIAMMAYGTEEVGKVDKIFGPGNQYVTAAKTLVSIDHEGCLVDMPAGPSEVLVIADENADPSFVAADLLSQAEHGADSQVILVTNSKEQIDNVISEIEKQTNELPRKEFIIQCLKNSYALLVDSIDDGIEFSNDYAPEHLILNYKDAEMTIRRITNAGSIFVGPFSPESAGDYASGTNHSLPTYGYAKSVGGVSVEMFMKSMTIQQLSKNGLSNIAETIIELAEAEKLIAHANAVRVRFK